MMEKNNKQQENPKESNPQTDAKLLENKPSGRSKLLLVWVAIVILLALIAGAFWYLQQQLHVQQLEPVAQTENASSIERVERMVNQLKQTVNDDSTSTKQRFAELNDANLILLGKFDSLAKTQELTNDDVLRSWTLAELQFLLQSANKSILLAGDIDKAQIALTLADQQLRTLTDPRLHELRALIADEQLALASVAKVDIDGLAIQLQSSLNKVDDLQVLMGPQFSSPKDEEPVAESSVASTWKPVLSDVWQEVKSLVVIRHQEDAAAAVLVPEQRYFLYQNLRLKLESAKLGLLSARELAFHDNLASATKWLQQYFIGPERDAMIDMLQGMQSQTITVDIPDISASSNWLQHYGDQQ